MVGNIKKQNKIVMADKSLDIFSSSPLKKALILELLLTNFTLDYKP